MLEIPCPTLNHDQWYEKCPHNTGKIIRMIKIVASRKEISNKINIRRERTLCIKGGGGWVGESLGGTEVREVKVNLEKCS